MALSRKKQRKLNQLRNDADRLWAEQQVVLAKARELAGRAGTAGRDYANSEILPPLRKSYERNVRPAFDEGVSSGRKALRGAESALTEKVLPALAAVGGNVTGAVREFTENNKALHTVQDRAGQLGKDASKRFAELQTELTAATEKAKKQTAKAKEQALKAQRKAEKKQRKGLGFGGWFLVGSAVTAVAALSYALWQTFRADDDLWIADEELDAPVTSVEAPAAE